MVTRQGAAGCNQVMTIRTVNELDKTRAEMQSAFEKVIAS